MPPRPMLLLGSAALLLATDRCWGAQQVQLNSATEQPRAGSSQGASSPAASGPVLAIGDAERSAITCRAYDLTVQLRQQDASMSVLARVTVRNDSAEPLPQIALQISSSLHWESVSEKLEKRTETLSFNQHLLQTDADHTGEVSEAVVRLSKPLRAHELAELTLLYSGFIQGPSARLGRADASRSSAAADWDQISPEGTFLRGFGDVLWYPVASPQVFLGDGASLLRMAGRQMLRQAGASARLRISVEYTGDAPAEAFFCGRKEPLVATSDNADAPVADAPGIATADFAAQEIGFGTPSLFVTGKPVLSPDGLATVSRSSTSPERLSSVSTPIQTLLAEWLGRSGIHVLTVIDHEGAPFAEGDLLVMPISGAASGSTGDAALVSALVPSLTHARFRSAHIWLDEGVAQFMSLLWLERTQGRIAAVSALEEQSHALSLAESVMSQERASRESLLSTSDAMFYRSKAATVLWLLRDIVGDDALKQAFQRYDHRQSLDVETDGFEKVLEQTSGKSLRWFFDDWVYYDKGLPELSIVSVAPRELSSKTAQGTGWLVAVEVRNDGGAVAEVPVTIRSGSLTATERLRISAHSVASTRILFQGVPEEVQVNDGTVPELIASTHLRDVVVH